MANIEFFTLMGTKFVITAKGGTEWKEGMTVDADGTIRFGSGRPVLSFRLTSVEALRELRDLHGDRI